MGVRFPFEIEIIDPSKECVEIAYSDHTKMEEEENGRYENKVEDTYGTNFKGHHKGD